MNSKMLSPEAVYNLLTELDIDGNISDTEFLDDDDDGETNENVAVDLDELRIAEQDILSDSLESNNNILAFL